MTKDPIVTVIMTVYNGERYVAQAIESILQQSLRDFEFMIVDDGSEDRTPEILAEAEANDPRIKVISKPRLGRARALNVAWTHAKGTYIANIDADDMAEPLRLKKQVEFLLQHPEVGLLGTRCKTLEQNSGNVQIHPTPLNDIELRKSLVRYNPFIHSSVMTTRQVLIKMGGYNEKFKVGIDYELWVRIAYLFNLACLPDILTVRRLDGSNFFLDKSFNWERCKTKVKTRWYAWRKFSGIKKDLYYVFCEPIGKFLNAWSNGRLTKIRLLRIIR